MLAYRGKAVDFASFLRRTVGKVGYIIGTRGQLWTLSMYDRWVENPTWEAYLTNLKLWGKKWIGHIVADCMGWYEMWYNGGDLDKPLPLSTKYPDINTYAMYDLAKREGLPNGSIETLPQDCPYPVAVGYPGHVGYYLDGLVYQAAGHQVGTLTTPLKELAWNKPWQYWYALPYLDYEGWWETVIQRGAKGPDVVAWQQALLKAGFSLPRFGADGDFGGETETATKAYQTAINQTADGVVRLSTLTAMLDTLRAIPGDAAALEAAQSEAITARKALEDAKLAAARAQALVTDLTTKLSAAAAEASSVRLLLNKRDEQLNAWRKARAAMDAVESQMLV
ncbi:MAG: putative peptidoglycan binding domain protein [Chloroflexi bacterium ADurb.Bin180]|nr:MAG: putative peptidoglycan binding domain protein [Chloroflexi bacterium ADurb.Bin180]